MSHSLRCAPAGMAGSRPSRASRATLLLVCLAACATALPPAFTESRFYSAGKVQALPEHPLDAANPLEVLKIGARAYPFGEEERELIVFQFTGQESRWLDFALNMVAQLAAAGYHHFVALAGRAQDCELLHAGWRKLGDAPGLDPRLVGFSPACVWSSAPVFTDGNSLWVSRYALLTSLVEQRINALLVDLDFVFHRDVYVDLYSPCIIPATVLVHAEGGGPNGGFFRVRGAHPDGAAHWILAQVKRRYDMYKVEQLKTGSWPGAVMDQEIIKDAVRVASYPTEGSQWDMGSCVLGRRNCDHPFWIEHPQNESSPGEPFTDLDVPDLGPCDGETRWDESTPGRRGVKGYFQLNQKPKQMSVLYKPRDAPGPQHSELPVEHLMWTPGFFVQYGNIAHTGWSESTQPPSSLTHMLKAKGLWMSSLKRAAEEGSHVSRQSMMMAHGAWLPQLNEERAAAARLLYLAEHVVTLAARHESQKRLRDVIARGLVAAALTGRVLVLPQIPCDSPWIRRCSEHDCHSLHGVQDPRIVVNGPEDAPRCYVGVHPNSVCWPWQHVAYSYDPIVARRLAQAKAFPVFDQDEIGADAADVVLGITPHALADQAASPHAGELAERVRMVESDCRAFFEPEGSDPEPEHVE